MSQEKYPFESSSFTPGKITVWQIGFKNVHKAVLRLCNKGYSNHDLHHVMVLASQSILDDNTPRNRQVQLANFISNVVGEDVLVLKKWGRHVAVLTTSLNAAKKVWKYYFELVSEDKRVLLFDDCWRYLGLAQDSVITNRFGVQVGGYNYNSRNNVLYVKNSKGVEYKIVQRGLLATSDPGSPDLGQPLYGRQSNYTALYDGTLLGHRSGPPVWSSPNSGVVIAAAVIPKEDWDKEE